MSNFLHKCNGNCKIYMVLLIVTLCLLLFQCYNKENFDDEIKTGSVQSVQSVQGSVQSVQSVQPLQSVQAVQSVQEKVKKEQESQKWIFFYIPLIFFILLLFILFMFMFFSSMKPKL
jgi:hypothetical protein